MNQIDRIKRIGNSEEWVSSLGIGCWSFGGGAYWGHQEQADVDAVVHQALDAGVNYFDTAEVYNEGQSEISLGKALAGRRSTAIIGSKFSTDHAAPKGLRAACEASLRRLRTDYIDLYMLHWPINPNSIRHFASDFNLAAVPTVAHTFAELSVLQKEGKIRHIGVSNHGVQQMKEIESLGVTIVANQLAYNLLSRAIENAILPYCREKDIGVIAYMPLLQGLLSGRYSKPEEVRPILARTRHFSASRGLNARHHGPGVESDMFQAIKGIGELASKLGVSMSVLALSWVMQTEGVSTAIVGCRNLQQLNSNLEASHFCVPDDARTELNLITEALYHRLGYNPDYYEAEENSRIY